MTRRVLMASWLFPPHASIGAKRAYRFARWLPSFGWDPTVLCRRAAPPSSHDPSPWHLPPQVTVRAEYDAAIFSRLAGHGPRATTSPEAEAAPRTLHRPWRERLAERWNLLVDAALPLETEAIHAPHAAAMLDRLAPSHDVVWSTSYPYHTHAIALRAARAHGKPLVVDLRDPWTPNWVHRRKFAHARATEAWLERKVFAAADRVVVTTWELEALYRAMFPAWADKFVTIHNAYDPVLDDAPPPDVRAAGAPRRLVHFGNVYGPWSFETLYRALAALRREGALGAEGVVFENYGKLSDRDRALATELGVGDLVRVMPSLPYERGMARLRGADGLLLAAWDDPDARLYVQGKLFDYLAAGRPVLAETAHRDVREIVRRAGAGAVVAPGDVGAMTARLRELLATGRLAGVARDDAGAAHFSAREATRRLATLLDEL